MHIRRSIRLPYHDYASAGVYYVTICTAQRQCILGEIVDDTVMLSTVGCVVDECWQWLAQQYPYIELDEYVVMPNHLHGILVISDNRRGGSRTAPTTDNKSLGRLVGAFKTVSTKRVNILRHAPGAQLWQRNDYEHIVRDEDDWNRIRAYIQHNPGRWAADHENPANAVR